MSRRRPRRAQRSLLRAPRDALPGARAVRRQYRAPRSEQHGPPAAVVLGAPSIQPLRATLRLNLRGGLTIPANLRRALAIDGGGALIAEATSEGLLLRPALTFPLDECDAKDAHRALAMTDPLPSFPRAGVVAVRGSAFGSAFAGWRRQRDQRHSPGSGLPLVHPDDCGKATHCRRSLLALLTRAPSFVSDGHASSSAIGRDTRTAACNDPIPWHSAGSRCAS